MATDMRVAGKKIEALGDGINEPVGNFKAATFFCDVIPDVIGDSSNNRVRMVDTIGIIHTIAGNGTCGFSGDGGPGVSAMLCSPSGVAVDANGNLYVADWSNNRVRRVDAGGTIGTIAGTGSSLYNGNGLPARKTNILPFSVAVSPSGNVYVVDYANNRVREIQ
jgi:hypothetical protein